MADVISKISAPEEKKKKKKTIIPSLIEEIKFETIINLPAEQLPFSTHRGQEAFSFARSSRALWLIKG